MNMPLARKIYWSLSLAGLVVLWTGMWRRHQGHEAHYAVCKCMPQCLPCAFDALRAKKEEKNEDNGERNDLFDGPW